ncbi:MAG: hypothetical protein HYY90_00660 [Candidatus Omnitrophica bacterium]|nr:hypothetical protein [Candidatus Omnitrophota bacterium]
MNPRRWLVLVCVVGILGCSTSAGLKRSDPASFSGEAAPTVLVKPVVADPAAGQTDHLSSDEFTRLLVHQLRSKGVRAGTSDTGTSAPDYVLTCTVPHLGYTIRRRYPTQVKHEATLSCSIIDPTTQAVRWQRNVERHNDVTTLLNTMTKLPPRHEAELLRECVLPVWDGMAYGVRLFLDRPQMAARPEPASPTTPRTNVAVRADTHTWMK